MSRTRDLSTASLYFTACYAATMLAAAEGGWMLPTALTVPIAVAAYSAVERRGRGISTLVANALGVTAIVAALIELAVRDIEGRILFGAHLLIYLTWILLWQPKGSQQRWGLIALGVLQVAVGAVLTNAGTYGLALAGFLVLTVWTLVLLQLAEAEARHAHAAVPAATGGTAAALLLAPGRVAAAGPATLGRWPTRQILAVVAATVAGATTVGAAFFLFIPRFEVSRTTFDETDTPLARRRVTGFTERVRLGSFGEILESSTPVFEVRLFEGRGDTPVDVEKYAAALGYDEPLFRGMTLRDYDHGEWAAGGRRGAGVVPVWPFRNQIRQEYRLQPISSEALFAIAPVYAGRIEGTDDLIRKRFDGQTLFRPPGLPARGELKYEVYSLATAADAERFRGMETESRLDEEALRPYLALPGGLSRLRAIAAEVARRGGDAEPGQRAERLSAYLRDSGEFRYSLTGELIDPGLDPIEDFLVNTKTGHCEYFASALALMLRAEGIPSRVVSGFKGGERNRLNGTFVVQQRHAHAWVEAYLGGRWVTLDPSPASGRSRTVAANAPPVPLWNDVRSAASAFWREYVVQMNLSRQQRTLGPLRDALSAFAESFREDWWPALTRQAYALATDPSRWFSWQGGVASFVGLLLIVAVWRVGRRVVRRLARMRAARAAELRRGRRVEFYERFRRLCERRGWTAASGQTPREFAADVRARLVGGSVPVRLAGLPGELTEDFYRVRFGDLDLPEPRVRDLESRLEELEAALSAGDGRPAAAGRTPR